jgi:hypothetical protein
MVVEDDPALQSLVEEALTEGGFETAISASGEEAVTLLKNQKGKYRALVTDIHLTGKMDGWMGSREASQRNRPGVSHYLHDRRCGRRMGFPRRSQEHSVGEALCSGTACYGNLESSQRCYGYAAFIIQCHQRPAVGRW